MSETHTNQCVCLDQPETTICDNPFIFNGTCTHCGHVFECHYVGAKTIPLEISETKLPPLDVKFTAAMKDNQAARFEAMYLERERQLTAALEREEKEIGRWQHAIYRLLHKTCGDSIDGGGCDSGDPLDFTVSEISQALTMLNDRATAAEANLAALQVAARDYLDNHNHDCMWMEESCVYYMALRGLLEEPTNGRRE